MSEQEKRDLLFGYMRTEPLLYINCEHFRVVVIYEYDGPIFYAISDRMHSIGAAAKIEKETWKCCQSGLSLAMLYNVVLDNLEHGVIQSGGMNEGAHRHLMEWSL